MKHQEILEAVSAAADKHRPVFVILIGPPGCGKTTWARDLMKHVSHTYISTDSFPLLTKNKTWQTIWRQVHMAVNFGDHVVFDQTNMTKERRAQILSKVPSRYVTIAVDLHDQELQTLEKRVGARLEAKRRIPSRIIYQLLHEYQPPREDEGFAYVFMRGVR